MSDESILRKKAREAIQARRLPKGRPERMWGGPGVGASCTICGERMGYNEVEFELQFAGDDGGRGLDTYHVHIGCFAAWEFERQSLETARAVIVSGEPVRPAAAPLMDSRTPQPSTGSGSRRALLELCNDGMIACDGRNDQNNRGEPGG